MENHKRYKIYIAIFVVTTIVAGVLAVYFGIKSNTKEVTDKVETVANDKSSTSETKELKELTNFNYAFLKLENEKQNKIYSPLSIRYALNMLKEGTTGESKLQISKVIGEPSKEVAKYTSSNNMSFANALFVRDTFKENVKQSYIDTLKSKYAAEINYDPFTTPENINNWISSKTFNLINNLLGEIKSEDNFFLVNALGIDMEWENQFFENMPMCRYIHENFGWDITNNVVKDKFGENNLDVSTMQIAASINNYDIVSELGEENIVKKVSEEYRKWAKGLTQSDGDTNYIFGGDLSDANIEKKLNEYLYGGNYYNTVNYNEESKYEGYISEIKSNYKEVNKSVDFSIYTDDKVKVFAKDLKEYNGTKLQYVGIMPINESLDKYVENINEKDINKIIENLKELKSENFKKGVITKITGYIPKFKFEYELNLKNDLNKLGVTDIFEKGKANLTEFSDNNELYVGNALHKANIEFTQEGIKATAATLAGGLGAGGSFDYIYDVPVEEIDLTFNKPYMFLIRDNSNGEVWFTGTVYEPLLWENEPFKEGR